MEFFEAVHRRRSVRKYTGKMLPVGVVDKAIDAALVAPNSSNMQTWQFYWVQDAVKKSKLIEACLSQGSAKTAAELIVVVADRSLWKTRQQALIKHFQKTDPRPSTLEYYQKLMPFLYGWIILAPAKWLLFNAIGLFRPMARRPWSARDIDEVAIKSAALGAQNFMLAIAAQGYDTCPMEGFDESRVKKVLNLGCTARVVMVISVGERESSGVWGERYRVPRDWSVIKV